MKIIPILLNPTVDEIYEIENFHVGGTFKVNNKIIYPVGKAISFSLGIRELNEKQELLKVIALIGKEEIMLYSNFLKSKNIDFEFIEVNGKTRSNKTINDPRNKTTTHIREKGFDVNEGELLNFYQTLQNNVEEGDICVFSGSLPSNLSNSIYFELINFCHKMGASCILDSSGDALIYGIKANPEIIKPNLVELSQILDKSELNTLDFQDIHETCITLFKNARTLLNEKLKIILITLGDKGALCETKDCHIYGNVKINHPIDTVGSGDSFLSGFITSFFLKKNITECFKMAIACGAANTLIPGPGFFKKQDVKDLYDKIKLKKF